MCKWRTVRDRSALLGLGYESRASHAPLSPRDTIPLDARRSRTTSPARRNRNVCQSTHTAIVGPAGCGASTLLRSSPAMLKPQSGEVRIGSRVVNDLKRARRPLLYTTSAIDAPGRWSVRHLLVAAARQRTIDREDRQQEIELAATKWKLGSRPPARHAVIDREDARESGADRDSRSRPFSSPIASSKRRIPRRISPTSFTGRFA